MTKKVLHICNPIFGTDLASTFKLVLQRVTHKIKGNSFTSEWQGCPQTPLGTVCAAAPALLLSADECHIHLRNNGSNCVQHHFPELSLLNTVQIIGYVNMHNAF